MALLPALITGGASLIGSIFGRNAAKSAERAQQSMSVLDRKRFEQDRVAERQYNKLLTDNDRAYAEKMLADERKYAASVLLDQRSYSENALASDRAYLDLKQGKDWTQYARDREFMQSRSNELAEKTAASRGIDFTRLRDDAIKAGYNPMTALSMAHAYSTQVDYGVQGGPYSNQANFLATSAPGGGGGGAAPGAVMGSHVPAGGSFTAGGAGYSNAGTAALSTAGFISDALERTADLWTNQPVAKDPLAEALRNAFQHDQMANQVRDAQIPQGFGYDLTKQKPFQPAATMGVPALASDKAAIVAPKMPSGVIESGGRKYIPVTKPDGKPGRLEASIAGRLDINPFDTVSPGDWAEIVGEVGEIESGVNQPGIRRNITDEWHLGVPASQSMRDYLKSGVTGNPMLGHSQLGAW
nr:MAG: hypothetical protein [Microvirus sp.]